MAEGVVGRQEEPTLAAFVRHGGTRALGQGGGIEGVVHGVGAALLIGQRGRARAVVDEDALFFLSNLGHGQGRVGVRAAKDQADALGVYPFADLAGREVGPVLVISREQLDGLAQDLAAKVVDGHLYGRGSVPAFDIGVEAGHVGDEADLDCFLGPGGGGQRGGQGESEG